MRRALRCLLALIPLLWTVPVPAQDKAPRDSLVKELSAQSNELIEKGGVTYRKVTGPARFLHNNTYLLCDTALWNVNARLIEARGNVQIIQDRTVLKSDKLDYVIDQDLAQFRGSLVQLRDKDGNTLRTRFLDYNTRDSVAVFFNGGAMVDKDGQVIESVSGTYDSKIKLFTFTEKVNMYTDSIFLKTTRLNYDTAKDLATFGTKTSAWKDEDMLYADAGWYDRGAETFLFHKKVHVMTRDQEGWADSLYYYSLPGNVEMLGHAQVLDTTRDVAILAGRLFYEDSLKRVTLTRDPVVIAQTRSGEGENEKVDTVWIGADLLVYDAIRRCDIDSSFVKLSNKRLTDTKADAVTQYRKTAYEEAKKTAEETKKAIEEGRLNPDGTPISNTKDSKEGGRDAKSSDNLRGGFGGAGDKGGSGGIGGMGGMGGFGGSSGRRNLPAPFDDDPDPAARMTLEQILQIPDSLLLQNRLSPKDSLELPPLDSLGISPVDSLGISQRDSLDVVPAEAPAAPQDTSRIGFVTAKGKVRIFRNDMQVRCNLLEYNDLDSLVRLYEDPVIWHEKVRQYTADSIAVMLKERKLERASLMSNAFIVIQETKDTTCFDQIKGTDMMAFFDGEGGLSRFDVLGGAQLLFYLEENDTLATVNKAGSKMLSARLVDGNIETISYFSEPKSDAYPVVQLPPEEKILTGYNWQPGGRPASPEDISPLKPRPSERTRFAGIERPEYKRTEEFFPGHMAEIRKSLAAADSLKEVRRREREVASLRERDSLAMAESLEQASRADTLKSPASESGNLVPGETPAPADTLAAADSLSSVPAKVEISEKEAKKALKEQERNRRQEAREAKWRVKDERDAAARAAKEEKKRIKKRRKTLKLLKAQAERERKEEERLLQYKERYLKRQAEKAEKAEKSEKSGKVKKIREDIDALPAPLVAPLTEKGGGEIPLPGIGKQGDD